MDIKQHTLAKYIQLNKLLLDAIPEENFQQVSTAQLQVMCLEVFANIIGYELKDGLFVSNFKGSRVMALNNMVKMYNTTVPQVRDMVGSEIQQAISGLLVERVYLSGRSLRRGFKVMKHQVKFI